MQSRHDRQLTHRFLWKYYVDRDGMLMKSQRQLASLIGAHYQTLSNIFEDFMEDGIITKQSKDRFQMVDPDVYYQDQ